MVELGAGYGPWLISAYHAYSRLHPKGSAQLWALEARDVDFGGPGLRRLDLHCPFFFDLRCSHRRRLLSMSTWPMTIIDSSPLDPPGRLGTAPRNRPPTAITLLLKLNSPKTPPPLIPFF